MASYIVRIFVTRGVSTYSIVLHGMWDYVLSYETYSFIAPCNGLQGAVAQYAANRTRNPGQTPSLFDKFTGFFYIHYTTHGTNGFTSHPNSIQFKNGLLKHVLQLKTELHMPTKDRRTKHHTQVSYLGHRCHDWDSNHTLLIRNTRS